MSVKDWVVSQLVSKSLASSRPLSASESFLSEEPLNGEFDNQGICLSLSLLWNHFILTLLIEGFSLDDLLVTF